MGKQGNTKVCSLEPHSKINVQVNVEATLCQALGLRLASRDTVKDRKRRRDRQNENPGGRVTSQGRERLMPMSQIKQN
jgi:hypothetical protein